MPALILFLGLCGGAQGRDLPPPPHLEARNGVNQLILDGHPFIALGGELENSTPSDLTLMATVWPQLAAMHMNTAIVPAYSYLAAWYVLAGLVYVFFGIETKGRSFESIENELEASRKK